jgi:hypothetical protein
MILGFTQACMRQTQLVSLGVLKVGGCGHRNFLFLCSHHVPNVFSHVPQVSNVLSMMFLELPNVFPKGVPNITKFYPIQSVKSSLLFTNKGVAKGRHYILT